MTTTTTTSSRCPECNGRAFHRNPQTCGDWRYAVHVDHTMTCSHHPGPKPWVVLADGTRADWGYTVVNGELVVLVVDSDDDSNVLDAMGVDEPYEVSDHGNVHADDEQELWRIAQRMAHDITR